MADQLVQASTAGLVVAVAVPADAATPVNDGMEKNVAWHAEGELVVIDASFVNVTVSVPLAATVSAVVSVCAEPDAAVEKFQITSLGVAARHPVCVVVNAEVV